MARLLSRYSNPWDSLTSEIIGAAIEVHRELGPGLLEAVYEECLGEELSIRGIEYRRQVSLPLKYRGRQLDCGYRIDFIIGPVVLELKSVEHILPIHRAQLITYLRLARLPCALMINFNVPTLVKGIVRVLGPAASVPPRLRGETPEAMA